MTLPNTGGVIPGISPQNGMVDFLLYQMIIGKSQELTMSGIVMMLLMSNISEIKKIIGDLLTWFKNEILMIIFKYIKSLFGYGSNTPQENDKNNIKTNTDLIHTNQQTKMDMTLTPSKASAKTQVDLLALVNYMIHNNIYLPNISNIYRVSNDKYSAIEEHDMCTPIVFTYQNKSTQRSIRVELNEQIKAKVEISPNSGTSIKVHEVTFNQSNLTEVKEITINEWNDLKGEFIPYLAQKFPFPKLWKRLKSSTVIGFDCDYLEDSYPVAVVSSSGVRLTLYRLWDRYYRRYFSKGALSCIVLWLYIRDGNIGVINFLLLPFKKNSYITIGGTMLKCNPLETVLSDGSNPIDICMSFNMDKYYNGLFKNFKETLIGNHDEDFEATFKNMVMRDGSSTEMPSLIFTGTDTSSHDELYGDIQDFLQSISNDYYKFIKLPQAYKEVKIFTIKIQYLDKPKSIPNPEWEKYCKNKQLERDQNAKNDKDEKNDEDEDKSQSDKSPKKRGKEPNPPPETLTIMEKSPELQIKQVRHAYKPIEYLYMSKNDKTRLQSIISNFTTNAELYTKLGIQHKMALMLHGKPGTGKTTAIISIASFLQRDIYYLDLQGILTNSHLQLVFDYLQANCGGGSVVVLEDIDCMTPIVLKRDTTNQTPDNTSGDDKLTLSYFLNLLDGTLSIEDLVVIMTTNHPEKLDPALYRPGRVDASMEFKNCDIDMIKTIFTTMFGRELESRLIDRIIPHKFTPAEVIFHFLPKLYNLDESSESILDPFLAKP